MRLRGRRIQARLAAPAALAVLACAGIAVAITSVGSSAAAGGASAERTVVVKRGVVQSTVSGSGTLSPANEVDLNFGASGAVRKIYVTPGEHVSSGQLLATIDPSSAEVDLAQARATLQSARDALTGAQSSGSGTTVSAPARDGSAQTVSAGTGARLARISTIALPVQAAPATPDAAALAKAKAKALAKAKAKALAKAKAAAAAKSAAKPSASSSAGGSGGRAVRTAGASGSASSGAGASSGSAGSGGSSGTSVASATAAVQSAELSVTKAERALAATKLRAPMAGTIAAVDGAVGDTVGSGSSASASSGSAGSGSNAAGAGDDTGASTASGSGSGTSSAFITLAQVSRFRMDVSLSESDIGKVKAGQAATVTVNAVAGTELAAHVERVGVLASSSSSSGAVSYPVTLKLDQSSAKLKAGMSATAEIVVAEASGLVVPSQAVTGTSVTVVRSGKRSTQTVQTGVVGETSTEVLSGLTAGDEVVVRSASAAAGANAGSAATGATGAQQTRGANGFRRAGGTGAFGGGGAVLRVAPGGGP